MLELVWILLGAGIASAAQLLDEPPATTNIDGLPTPPR